MVRKGGSSLQIRAGGHGDGRGWGAGDDVCGAVGVEQASGRKERGGETKETDRHKYRKGDKGGGLPVDVDKLQKVFYRMHGGGDKAANMAWHRALRGSGLEVDEEGKVFRFE